MPPNARCTEEADVKCGNARDTRPKLGQFARQCESNIVERMRSSVTDTLLTLPQLPFPALSQLFQAYNSSSVDIHVGICQLCGGWTGGLKVPGQGGQCGTGGQSDGYVMLNWPG